VCKRQDRVDWCVHVCVREREEREYVRVCACVREGLSVRVGVRECVNV